MSTTERSAKSTPPKGSAPPTDMRLEVVVIPVADPDRSKEYDIRLGWRLDADFAFDNHFRVVQFTPPGSGSSMQFGSKITTAPLGSVRGLYLVVSDIEAARAGLAARGVEISDVFHSGRRARSLRRAPTVSVGQTPGARATAPSPRSPTLMGTSGCCRRSRSGFPAGSTPPRPRLRRPPIWPARCVGRRLRTASTRSGTAASTT